MKHIKYLPVLIMMLSFFACERKDKCANASIAGAVKHYGKIIPYSTVYLKKGSRHAPADMRNPKAYDRNLPTDANAAFTLSDLAEGDYYYLFGIGLMMRSRTPYMVEYQLQ